MELLKDCPFEFDQTKKLGHMRCDFDGGQDIRPYKSWFGVGDFAQKCVDMGIEIQWLDDAVNKVCNEWVNTYSKLLKYCGEIAYTSPYDSVNYYFQYKDLDVWVRMIPAKGDYNMYINLYYR